MTLSLAMGMKCPSHMRDIMTLWGPSVMWWTEQTVERSCSVQSTKYRQIHREGDVPSCLDECQQRVIARRFQSLNEGGQRTSGNGKSGHGGQRKN